VPAQRAEWAQQQFTEGILFLRLLTPLTETERGVRGCVLFRVEDGQAVSLLCAMAGSPDAAASRSGGLADSDDHSMIRYGDYVVLEVPEKGICFSRLFG
jgi:hypothetical protein